MFGAAEARDRAQVFGELAAMVAAGVSIGEAVTVVAQGIPSTPMQRALMHVGREVSSGESFTASLKLHPDTFSPLTIAMLEVGEQAGRLEEALRTVADYFERDFELRSLLKRELTYPIILLIAILFIPLIARMIVVWISETLPAALIAGAEQFVMYALVIGVPALLIRSLARSMRRSREGRIRIDRIKLSIPLVGTVLRKLAVARFCRALASLYSAGVMMGTALRLAGQASGNAVVESDLGGRARLVDEGRSLSEALVGSSLLPGTVLRMLKTGETTGEVDAMAHRVAGHLEQEAQTALKQMAVAITPIVVVIAGIIVAVMVISFYVDFYAF